MLMVLNMPFLLSAEKFWSLFNSYLAVLPNFNTAAKPALPESKHINKR